VETDHDDRHAHLLVLGSPLAAAPSRAVAGSAPPRDRVQTLRADGDSAGGAVVRGLLGELAVAEHVAAGAGAVEGEYLELGGEIDLADATRWETLAGVVITPMRTCSRAQASASRSRCSTTVPSSVVPTTAESTSTSTATRKPPEWKPREWASARPRLPIPTIATGQSRSSASAPSTQASRWGTS
jgi:hypothetical protein